MGADQLITIHNVQPTELEQLDELEDMEVSERAVALIEVIDQLERDLEETAAPGTSGNA